MGEFSPYEQVEQLDLAGHVWTARKGAGKPAQYVIKLAPGPRVEPGSEQKVTALRTSAELQKKLADAKTPGWAVVHQVGQTVGGGAYYVTNNYPWSLQLLIEQKDEVTSENLGRVVDQIAVAVQAMASKYGRAHADLKLANILLTHRDLHKATVALSDPAPPGSAASMDPTADRRGLGRVIFELVTGLAYQDYFWPVRSQRAWEALGADGLKWLEWCNRLLAPAKDATACTVEQFRQELRGLGPATAGAGKRGAAPMVIVAAVVAALAGGGFWWQHQRSRNTAVPAPSLQAQAPAEEPVQTPAPAPAPAPTPVVAPAPAPPPPPAPVAPMPVLTPEQQQAIAAAQTSTQADLDAAISRMGDLAFELQSTIPDLYDVDADMQRARNVALPAAVNPADVATKGKAALAAVAAIRRQAVTKAIAASRGATFKNAPIDQGFAAWNKTAAAAADANSEKSLLALAHMIHALRQIDAVWPGDVTGNARVEAAFANKRNAAVSDAIALAGQNPTPTGEKAAVDQFEATAISLTQAAKQMTERHIVAAAVMDELRSTQPRSAADWETARQRLTNLPPGVAGWPAANVDTAFDRVSRVLAALACENIHDLQHFIDTGATPALITAVAQRFTTVHGDADQDAALYQSLKGEEAIIAQPVARLWLWRMAGEADPGKARHLAELANTMNLPAGTGQLAAAYYNARLSEMRKAFNASAEPVKAFYQRIEPMTDAAWPMDDATRATIKKNLGDVKLGLYPPPGGKTPPNFHLVSGGAGDYVYVPPFDPAHPIRFLRVVNKATGVPFYLSSTEVTVGWFFGLVADERKVVPFRKLMDSTIPGKLAGPSAWRADFIHSQIGLNSDRTWLAYSNHHWDDNASRYAPAGPGPTERSPMQYVSPLAAMDAARLAGCRLPTETEWQSAYESPLRDGDENTSGQNWVSLRNSIQSLSPGPSGELTCNKFKMEVGIIDSRGQALPYAGPIRQDAGDVLWFRNVPVNADKFRDMAGNISEWVLSDAGDMLAPRIVSDEPITVADETGTHVVANQRDPSLAPLYDRCLRIGLSTISPAGSEAEKGVIPDDPGGAHQHQFFDVGFRLAMNDPAAPTGPSLATVVSGLQAIR